MKNLSKGLCLCLVGAVLSLAALIVYAFVMYKMPVVFAFLAAAVVLTLCAVLAGSKLGKAIGLLPWCNSLLNAGALVAAVYLMVNQIGYVVSSLDTIDTIISFIIFEVIALVAMIINIVASFLQIGPEETVTVEVEAR